MKEKEAKKELLYGFVFMAATFTFLLFSSKFIVMSYEIEIEYYDQDGAIFYIGETPYQVELFIETRNSRRNWIATIALTTSYHTNK